MVRSQPAMQETQVQTLGWKAPLRRNESEQTPGDSKGQGSLAWGHRELDIT